MGLRSDVWVIRSRLNPFPVQGVMTLDDGIVRLTVTGGKDCIAAMREYLEDQSGIAGLRDRLAAGEAVQVLEFATTDAAVSFPATSGGYIAKIDVGGKDWYVALAYPAGGGMQNVVSMKKGRRLAKEWKAALAG